MKKTLLIAVIILSSFAGGMVSSLIFSSRILAQTEDDERALEGEVEANVVRAHRIEILDDRRRPRITIEPKVIIIRDSNMKACTTLDSNSLYISDENSKCHVALGPTMVVTPDTGDKTTTAPWTLRLFDKDGKVLFKAP